MAGHEKLLKKVEQERSKGQLERALGRLKEAITQHPRDFSLVREAAALCFEMGRTLEGAGILRAAIKRCPQERPAVLELLEREFDATKQGELGEILFETHLAAGELDRSREVVVRIPEGERSKLLVKLRTKLASVQEESPDDAAKLTAILLAEALVLSAQQQSIAMAAVLERVLDLDPAQVPAVGRLAKAESKQAADCGPLQFLLARCYLQVGKFEMAAEHAVAAGRDASLVERALGLLGGAGDSAYVLRARAALLLFAGRYAEAEPLLASLLASPDELHAAVRATLEAVPEAAKASPTLRLVYAEALARCGALRPAQKEIQAAGEAGVDPARTLATTEVLLAHDPHSIEVLMLQARAALAADRPDVASPTFKRILDADPGRAETLRKEIESASDGKASGPMGRVLVDLYLQLELPEQAATALLRLRESGGAPAPVLYQLSSDVASRYGFSAPLLATFVESAIETEHLREARAGVAHYLGSPGVRSSEFVQLLGAMLERRPELAPLAARVVEGLPLPVEVRMRLAAAGLEGDNAAESLVDLEALVLEKPELRQPVLETLEALLARRPDLAEALILAGDLCESGNRPAEAARYLARALRAAPSETDRICKVAERVLRRDPKQYDSWREVVLALVDIQRHRHARELCYLAQQALPPEKHGFLHLATGTMMLAAKQPQAAVNELESALACEDAPVEEIATLLRQVVGADPRLGYARFVLAAALLRQGTDLDAALVHLSAAVQQDDLLMDLAFELLAEHSALLADHAPARVLEGLLHLRKGDRARGIALLDRALDLQPQLAAQLVAPLEAEWDRDPENGELGVAFARALRGAGHLRRACRLLADLARRFPDRQDQLVNELESMLEIESLPDVHRALWEILLERGRREAAQAHLQRAYDGTLEDEGRRDLLEMAQRRAPDSLWIACRLAELEHRAGRPGRAAEVLSEVLERDPNAWEALLDCVRGLEERERTEALVLLEADCLLSGRQGGEALDVLRRHRVTHPESREASMQRFRLLVQQQTSGLAAELEYGSLLREAGALEEAVRVLEAGLGRTQEPSSDAAAERELRLTLAQIYVELGRENEGKQLLSSVLDRPGNHQETYGFLERLARQGMLSRLASLRDTIATYPGNTRARLDLARLSIVSMDFEGAREALAFTGESAAVEAARRYLLARSHSDEDHWDLALAVLRSILIDDVADDELRRNIVYLQAVCSEHLGQHGEAHALFLQILSEFPYFKDVRERVRRTYQKHLEAALGPRAEVLEKRTHLDVG